MMGSRLDQGFGEIEVGFLGGGGRNGYLGIPEGVESGAELMDMNCGSAFGIIYGKL
jgi:hypothetical protein